MGNVLDSLPPHYSTDSPSTVQAGNWEQTYAQRPDTPGDNTDKINWGQGRTLQIGAKMMQDPSTNEFYIMTKAGQKITMTTDGGTKFVTGASALIREAKNYGRGPMVTFAGDPLHPKVFMYAGSDESKGNYFAPEQINSYQDLVNAVQPAGPNHTPKPRDGKYSAYFGNASIAGPFNKKGKDFWSGVSDWNRGLTAVTKSAAVPLLTEVGSKVIPGLSTAMQVTGITDDLSKDFSDMVTQLQNSHEYQGADQYDLSLSNVLHDPRLQNYAQNVQDQHMAVSKQTNTRTPGNILGMPSQTPVQIIMKSRQLRQGTNNMLVNEQIKQLNGVVDALKKRVPNADWSYIDQMQSGLAIATNNTARINILNHFAEKITTDIVPKLNQQTPVSPGVSPSPPEAPPRGSGFGNLSYNPFVINGEYYHHPKKNVIKG